MFILLAASSNWQIPCTTALSLSIKFVGLFTFLGSWGDLEVVRLEVEMWWNHPWPSSWKTPKHRVSPHILILILSTICLETKNSWLGRLNRTVKTFSVATHLFRGMILNISKSLGWGTSDSMKLSKWYYVRGYPAQMVKTVVTVIK